MKKQRKQFVIQCLDSSQRWFSVGSDPDSGWAQRLMQQKQRAFPDKDFRVVEHPSRRLIVAHCPTMKRNP